MEELEVWQDGRKLTNMIYAITKKPAFSTDFALRDQIRRAVISITSNIAEGLERSSKRQFLYFLKIAKGSANEVRSQLYIALDQGYINQDTFQEVYEQASRTISKIGGLIYYLESN
ncbi:MAG: four helix bundle protein [Bacteroidota bacterium]